MRLMVLVLAGAGASPVPLLSCNIAGDRGCTHLPAVFCRAAAGADLSPAHWQGINCVCLGVISILMF